MKVIKDNYLSILFKPWGYRQQYYLHLAAIFGFDLLAPDTLLTEQDLWTKLPLVMEDDQILDEAMPKVRAEFLVSGKCHAPAGEKIPACRVKASVGSLEKSLHVFGNRRWRRNPAGMQVISDPEPFSAIELSYKNAFGGPDFKQNPVGKGHDKNGPDENGHSPLPNIELPGSEMGAPSDRPEPAGFAPLDRMWPQRFQHTGTYDDEWQKTRWPYFPADMDYEFFNMAPIDQRLHGYFRGNEAFFLENMHPEHRRIHNFLPPVRPRQFIYKKMDIEKGWEPENLLFEEVTLKLDTVWFFPQGLFGVLIFHGSAQIQDEEYHDVHRLYLTRESAKEPPGDPKHYRDRMFSAMDMSVPIDMSPFEEARPKFESMLKQWRNIPKQIEETKQRAMGKAPKMSYTPDETAYKLKKTIAGGYPIIDKLENLARDMHGKYGHLVKIDLTQFDAWRKRLGEMEQRTEDMAARAGEMGREAKQAEKQTGEQLREKFGAEQLAEQGIDPDNLLDPEASDPWRAQAFSFVMQCRKNLENDPDALDQLAGLGFETRTIERAWLGVNTESTTMDTQSLGLDPENIDEDPVIVPPGLVLPVFEEVETCRVAVRPGPDWTDPDNEFILPESLPNPVFTPACLEEIPPVLVVLERMAAILLEQEIGDACSVLWLQEPGVQTDETVQEALSNAPAILLVASPASMQGKLEKWGEQWENARSLLLPDQHQNLFAASHNGLKIRPWILGELPEEFAQTHDIEIELPAAGDAPKNFLSKGLNLPPMDIKGLIDKALAEINAFYQPQKDAMQAEMEKILDKTAADLNMPRSELEAATQKGAQSQPDTPARLGRHVTDKLKADRETLRDNNMLTPDIDTKFQTAIENVEKDAAEAQARSDEMQAQLEASKKEIEEKKAQLAAGKLPEKGADKMRAAGLDPDRMRALDRWEVIEIHGRGESLGDYDLSGLDLSGLDLSGADLSRARCAETIFINTNLVQCNLSQVIANKSDFTGADLSGAKSDRALFPETVLRGTIFREVNFKQISFKDADLRGADFSKASLELISFEGCKADQVSFADAHLELTALNGITGKEMNFTRMYGYKCLFQSSVLDNADFTEAVLPACMFMDCLGKGVLFYQADLSRASICQGCTFPGCDLRNARMIESCIKDSNLSTADLRKAEMDGTLFENCDLTKACMRKTVCPRTKFNRVDMEGADLRGINLLTGSLERSRLVNADLSFSNLYGTDFYKAVFGHTKLNESNLELTLLAKGRQQYLE